MFKNIDNTVSTHAVMAAVLASTLTVALAAPAFSAELPPHVAGKVVGVSHEKVQVNNTWLDQVSVTVESCQHNGGLQTVHYEPGSVSSLMALGHLFEQDLQSARTMNNAKQNMTNGYAVFWTDATNKVTRTGILGSNLDCGIVPQMIGQFK